MPRLTLLDPGLQGRIGHHFTYSLAIVSEARRRGYDVAVWAHSAVRPEVIADLPARPAFHDHPYVRAFADDAAAAARAEGVGRLATRARADLENAGDLGGEGDVVLVHTAGPSLLLALVDACGAVAARPRLVAGLLPVNGERDLDLFDASLRTGADGALLYTHTRRQSALFSERFGVEVRTAPIPLELPARDEPVPLPEPGRLTVGYFGDNTRPDKGFVLLPDVVGTFARRPDVHFLVHAARDVPRDGIRETIERLRAAEGRGECTLVEGSLEADRYRRLLAACDVVLFPYDPATFRLRESALLGEALLVGAAACVPADSTLSEECEGTGAVFERFDTWGAVAVVSALERLVERAPALVAERARVARRYRDANAIGRYFEVLEL